MKKRPGKDAGASPGEWGIGETPCRVFRFIVSALHVLGEGRHMLGDGIMLHQEFAKLGAAGDDGLREHAPLYWDGTNELWGVSRYDDIVEIEKRKDVFVNSDTTKGGYRPNIPADPAIIGLDDPLHVKRRNLVSRRFTPKAVSWYAKRPILFSLSKNVRSVRVS